MSSKPSAKPKPATIRATKNYRLFHQSDENRPVNLRNRKALVRSLKEYGFLREYPIVCKRDGKGSLVVKDGQHRLAIAEMLGLPVYWVETATDYDIAQINNGQRAWSPIDYAERFAAVGNKDYLAALEFRQRYGLPVGQAFTLLAGTTSYTNIQEVFTQGKFKVRDQAWADQVASLYVRCWSLAPSSLRKATFLCACMAVCRVPEFQAGRFISNAERCRDKLLGYSTRDGYLGMMEDVYNYGRHKMLGLKAAALTAMRERNAVNGRARRKVGQ